MGRKEREGAHHSEAAQAFSLYCIPLHWLFRHGAVFDIKCMLHGERSRVGWLKDSGEYKRQLG